MSSSVGIAAAYRDTFFRPLVSHLARPCSLPVPLQLPPIFQSSLRRTGQALSPPAPFPNPVSPAAPHRTTMGRVCLRPPFLRPHRHAADTSRSPRSCSALFLHPIPLRPSFPLLVSPPHVSSHQSALPVPGFRWLAALVLTSAPPQRLSRSTSNNIAASAFRFLHVLEPWVFFARSKPSMGSFLALFPLFPTFVLFSACNVVTMPL
ncbi:hypothetical protein TRVL_04366 [Trypanosoma vivax]|nr:hypothetical protein TRVL_04366 [Trypanosoma vivax]